MARIIIELNTGDAEDNKILDAFIDTMKGVGGVTNLQSEVAAQRMARDIQETKEEPGGRAYGETTEDRSRRIKAEIAQDKEIDELWEKANGLEVPGLPDKIPTDMSADDLIEDLKEAIASAPEEDEGGFEMEDTDTKVSETEIMDLDEFQAVLQKGMKKLGGSTMGEIMDPHKNATSVPEEERSEYADKVKKAIADLD